MTPFMQEHLMFHSCMFLHPFVLTNELAFCFCTQFCSQTELACRMHHWLCMSASCLPSEVCCICHLYCCGLSVSLLHSPLALPFASFTCTSLSLSMDTFPLCLSTMACLMFRLSGWPSIPPFWLAPPFCLSKKPSPYILPFPFALALPIGVPLLQPFCPNPGVPL